jgi:hypothetical protein
MKIRPVGDELFHSKRQEDKHDEANSRFCAILRTRLNPRQNPQWAVVLVEEEEEWI